MSEECQPTGKSVVLSARPGNGFIGGVPAPGMNTERVRELIEGGVPDAQATVTTPRDPDDDQHYAAVVVSPAFDGESLVDRHQLVYDALGDHLTRSIHAIELETYTPAEYED
jgi:stress-induced morphogen